MNPFKMFSEAAYVATKRKDSREHRLGAVGVRKDGTKVYASNGTVIGPGTGRCGKAHAEARLANKLDVGSTVFIARVGGKHSDGNWLLAKPCPGCEMILRNNGIKRCYYTISNSEYGVMEL